MDTGVCGLQVRATAGEEGRRGAQAWERGGFSLGETCGTEGTGLGACGVAAGTVPSRLGVGQRDRQLTLSSLARGTPAGVSLRQQVASCYVQRQDVDGGLRLARSAGNDSHLSLLFQRFCQERCQSAPGSCRSSQSPKGEWRALRASPCAVQPHVLAQRGGPSCPLRALHAPLHVPCRVCWPQLRPRPRNRVGSRGGTGVLK